ncbi:MAG: clostripain-related cysteine peptidase [Caldilineaceae bacterium]
MSTPLAAWTVMVYLAGDNNLDAAGVDDLLEMKVVGSTPEVNVVAQFDRQSSVLQTRRFYLRQGGDLDADVVAELGETNTGDPAVLADFASWAITTYPAQRYMLVIWNHGSGWDDSDIYAAARKEANVDIVHRGMTVAPADNVAQGTVALQQLRRITSGRKRRALFRSTILEAIRTRAIAFDDAAQDFLDNIELKRVLASIKKMAKEKIDLLGMDACMMNMLEVGYQLRSSASILVGSEEIEPGDGWPYDTILAQLVKTPQMTTAELAKLIVDQYIQSYSAGEAVTLSAVQLSSLGDLLTELNKLAQALLDNRSDDALMLGLYRARQKVQSYDVADYVDLADLCQRIKQQIANQPVQAACEGVLRAVQTTVLTSAFNAKQMRGSHGISIYYPQRELSPLYNRLDFAKKSKWDEFLKAILA